ncbi:hypothetical protein ACFP3M_20820 [Streptomyces ramulosus]|uniref:Integral membrane protein n=1 Tax=Streptomyces ramulosus TaxID=47762 RepID=A0ABW1FP09_9ACTN
MINVLIAFLGVPAAVANPFCYIPMVCEAKAAIDFATDPIGAIAQKLAEANIWFLRKMLELLQGSTKIDLTSASFLKQYAIIFAASSLLTMALWLAAIAKRAVRGVSVTTAVGEAVGLLMLQFFVNALTPAAIGLLMKAFDEVTAVFEPYATSNFKPFLANLLKILAANPRDGLGQLITVNLVMLFGALLMWVELLIRSSAVYVAVALGPVVNAGLVDRDLWRKSKKWVGALFAIGLSKPVLLALLGLGGAVLSDSSSNVSDSVSKILVGALILLLAVFASGTVYRWVPAFGDEMSQLHHARMTAQSSGPASVVDGPAQQTNRVINTRIHDSLVGGRPSSGKAAGSAAGGKAGTASAKATTGGAKSGAGTASAAGPVGAAVAVAKAGVDLAKNRATSSPGAQGTDAANGGGAQVPAERGPSAAGSGAPASARARGTTSPVVSPPPAGKAAPTAVMPPAPPRPVPARPAPPAPPTPPVVGRAPAGPAPSTIPQPAKPTSKDA